MKYIVDRLEPDSAYLEDENCEIIKVNRMSVSPEAKEGSVVFKSGNMYIYDAAATDKRRGYMKDRVHRAFGRK